MFNAGTVNNNNNNNNNGGGGGANNNNNNNNNVGGGGANNNNNNNNNNGGGQPANNNNNNNNNAGGGGAVVNNNNNNNNNQGDPGVANNNNNNNQGGTINNNANNNPGSVPPVVLTTGPAQPASPVNPFTPAAPPASPSGNSCPLPQSTLNVRPPLLPCRLTRLALPWCCDGWVRCECAYAALQACMLPKSQLCRTYEPAAFTCFLRSSPNFLQKKELVSLGIANEAELCAVLRMQDLVVFCNATTAQLSGDFQVGYAQTIFGQENPQNAYVTDNAINCCLRCAFTNQCNVWVSSGHRVLCIVWLATPVFTDYPAQTKAASEFRGLIVGCIRTMYIIKYVYDLCR